MKGFPLVALAAVGFGLTSASLAQVIEGGPRQDIPEGVPLYRPLSGPSRQYFELAFANKYSQADPRWSQTVKSGPGLGFSVNDLDQEDLTTNVVFGETALSFGIGGLAQITGGSNTAAIVMEYARYRLVRGFRVQEDAIRLQSQSDLGVQACDFRIGYAVRVVITMDEKTFGGSGFLLNYINLGGSKHNKYKLAAFYQVVGISSPGITSTLPVLKIIQNQADVEDTLKEFKALIQAVANSFEPGIIGLGPKPGTICHPTLLGAVEFVPKPSVGKALYDVMPPAKGKP